MRRSIPAWAGEPRYGYCSMHHEQVYPRVGGGTVRRPNTTSQGEGLSPGSNAFVRDHGFVDPVIWTYDDLVLDGWHR